MIKQTVVHPHHGRLQWSEEMNYCTVKENINKRKTEPTEWEKIHASHPSDKRLMSKIYKDLIQDL